MRISIAMATYNGAQFIREQLDSLAAQTRLPDELVICDDGSSDRTVAIAEEFARAAPFPVEVHRNRQNLGYSKNFEKAASLCSGELVFFADQDDVWLPEKLAVVEARFANDPDAQVVINDAWLADADLRTAGHTQRQNIRRAGNSDKMFVTGCCSAHRKSWQQVALPIPDGIPAHDYWINVLAVELGCARHLDNVLQLYRRHGENESTWLLSDPEGVTFWQAVKAHRSTDARPGWRLRLRLLKEMEKRILERPDEAGIYHPEDKLPTIRAEIASLGQRLSICSLPRRQRAARVLAFWFRGGYRHAVGWKSAAKDLIRP